LKTKDGVRKKRTKRLQQIEKKADSSWRGTDFASNSWEKVPQVLSLVKGKLVKLGGKPLMSAGLWSIEPN